MVKTNRLERGWSNLPTLKAIHENPIQSDFKGIQLMFKIIFNQKT